MSKKTLWVIIMVGGLLAYAGYIFSILRPYFARVELQTVWELDYRSIQISKLHMGAGGTIFLTTENSGFIAVSPQGHELYRYNPLNSGYSYGYDDGSDDTLWVASMDFVDTSQLPQANYNQLPVPVAPNPANADGAAEEQSITYVTRLVCLTTAGEKIVDRTIEIGGFVSNLWCAGGQVYFMDTGQNLHCYDDQGNQVWVKHFPAMVDFSKGEGGLLFLDCGSEVVGINLEGTELWRTKVGRGYGLKDWRNWSTAAGRLCLVDNNEFVHVLDLGGNKVWSTSLANSYRIFGGFNYSKVSAKIRSDQTVYALAGDSTRYKYSTTGHSLWSFRAGSNVKGFDLDRDGKVYLQCPDKGLMGIAANGKLVWRDVRFGMTDIPPRVGTMGMLYIVQGNKLLALRIPN